VAEVERPLYLRVPRTSSFPSGHASSAFMAATLLADRDPHLRAVYFGLAALVATSRVHVRIHHASDVAAGTVLGLALGQIAKRAWPI
jgi:undecaprenyl-diphosphatase